MKTLRNRSIARIAVVALLIGSITATATSASSWSETVSAESQLPVDVRQAVLEALLGPEGEYAAYATYGAIIDEYGTVTPFTNIMASEAKHIDALKQILDRYAVPYPVENPYLGTIDAPRSVAEAAQAGVDAEIANVALYERQLAAAADYPDIREVFTNLQTASQESHLPAFQRAAVRYAGS
jgi:hypothetical protein